MKRLHTDYKKGVVKVSIESIDDLWHLSHIIELGDIVKGKTTRKIKKNDETDAVKKTVTLAILVKEVHFVTSLRVNGIVREGPEDVPLGSYHALVISLGDTITLTKTHWYQYQQRRLEQSEKEQQTLLICVLDREESFIARTTAAGYDILAHLKGNVAKKGNDDSTITNFYATINKQLVEYDKRYDPTKIIIASPSFWKEELLKHVVASLKRKIVQATCSHITKAAIDEVLKRSEVKEALSQSRTAEELRTVEELLAAIAKDDKAVYGMKNTVLAAQANAIVKVLITDMLITKKRSENTFQELDSLMKTVDKNQGTIIIISSAHDGGKKLDGIGGIGALLRYQIIL